MSPWGLSDDQGDAVREEAVRGGGSGEHRRSMYERQRVYS